MGDFTIREATRDDLPAIVAMVSHFLEATTYGPLFQPAPEALERLVGLVLARDAAQTASFVAEDPAAGDVFGLISVLVGVNLIGDTRFADELVWWVEPDHRADGVGPALLAAAEAWARGKDLRVLKMIAPFQSRVGRFYERYGYVPVETVYAKGLEHGSDHPRTPRPGGGGRPVRGEETRGGPASDGRPGERERDPEPE